MKLASYIADGHEECGLVAGDNLIDIGRRLRVGSMRALLEQDLLGAATAFAGEKSDRSLSSVRLLPVVTDPTHCFCVGVNYADHLREVQAAGVQRPAPKQPSLFIRFPETFVAHGEPLVLPRVSQQLDYEAELAVIIGRGGRYIPVSSALDHVAGYTCYNDGSIRDWQFHSSQVTSGKNFVGTGAIGPWLVTPDEIGDVASLAIELTVNGTVLQRGHTSDLIFPIAEIVSYASSFLPLRPGDVIATGTPAGVGFSRKPPIFLKPRDVCEVTIERIGVLRNTIING